MRSFTFACLLFVFSFEQASSQTDNSAGDIFEKVESEAFFPGGAGAWQKFLVDNLKPNIPVDNGAPIGIYTVWIQFVVNKEGAIDSLKMLTHNGYGMEQEVLRIFKLTGKWVPAQQNGRNVIAYRKQPVTFMVEDDNIQITTKDPYALNSGIENTVEIKVSKVKDEDLSVTMAGGKVIPKGNGVYGVTVRGTGRATMTIYNKKKDKLVGSVSFTIIN
jgi:hypothetical protein